MSIRHRAVALLVGFLAVGFLIGGGIAEADKKADQPAVENKSVEKEVAQKEAKGKVEKQEAEEELTALQKLMRKKLDSSQKILEGLAIEDFDLIQKGADELGNLTKAEEWRVSNDMMYRQYSQEFRSKAFQASRMAKKSNLEGAALSYVQVTLSCVECHKWVRAVLLADDGLRDIGAHQKLAGVR